MRLYWHGVRHFTYRREIESRSGARNLHRVGGRQNKCSDRPLSRNIAAAKHTTAPTVPHATIAGACDLRRDRGKTTPARDTGKSSDAGAAGEFRQPYRGRQIRRDFGIARPACRDARRNHRVGPSGWGYRHAGRGFLGRTRCVCGPRHVFALGAQHFHRAPLPNLFAIVIRTVQQLNAGSACSIHSSRPCGRELRWP